MIMNSVWVRRLAAAILVLPFGLQVPAAVANDHFIHGTVVTRDGARHEGMLRWEDEEVFWSDHFNGTKADNPWLDHLSDEDRQYLKSGRPLVVEHWTDAFAIFGRSFAGEEDYIHSFQVRFGDLERIVNRGGDAVTVHFRDADALDLNGGSNDIGARIRVLDRDGDESRIRWGDVQEVHFSQAPPEMQRAFGRANYGVVRTDTGEFPGLVQWDHDERLSVDVLDGERDGEDVRLTFEQIATIRKVGNASEVTTREGDTMVLGGTNDVDSDNRGIIVDVTGLGRVDIPWRHFESVDFTTPAGPLPGWGDFPKPRPLQGTVQLADGGTATGRLVFDLDEALDLEMLDGSSDGIDYAIPFRYIRRLEPRGLTGCEVELRDGRRLTLKGSDAGGGNDGVLVFGDDGEPVFVRWEQVTAITMN